jgi:hypothetical protein
VRRAVARVSVRWYETNVTSGRYKRVKQLAAKAAGSGTNSEER